MCFSSPCYIFCTHFLTFSFYMLLCHHYLNTTSTTFVQSTDWLGRDRELYYYMDHRLSPLGTRKKGLLSFNFHWKKKNHARHTNNNEPNYKHWQTGTHYHATDLICVGSSQLGSGNNNKWANKWLLFSSWISDFFACYFRYSTKKVPLAVNQK